MRRLEKAEEAKAKAEAKMEVAMDIMEAKFDVVEDKLEEVMEKTGATPLKLWMWFGCAFVTCVSILLIISPTLYLWLPGDSKIFN